MSEDMNVLLVGATGFLGIHICNLLLKEGYNIVGITHRKQHKDNLIPGVKYITMDISKEQEFSKLKDYNLDTIIHTAAYVNFEDKKDDLERCFNVNVRGTLNLLEYATENEIKHFVYSSSVSVYLEGTNKTFTEEDACSPSSYYGMSKLIGELLCKKYQKEQGINCCIFRYGGMYGYRANHKIPIIKFLENILKKEIITLFNENSRRNYLYVKDAAFANLFSITNKLRGTYNVVSDEYLKIVEMVKIITDIFKEYMPRVQYSNDKTKNDIVYDVAKLKNIYKGFPKYSFRESIYDIKSEIERYFKC